MTNIRPLSQSIPAARTPRAIVAAFAAIFLATFAILFVCMTRSPTVHDEGLVLTNAMRVAAGQIPHRDFYTPYGPAQYYALAWLFKLFGESVLVERILDLAFKATLVASIYAIVSQYFTRRVASFTTFLALCWVVQILEFSNPITAVALFNLLSVATILPAFDRRLPLPRSLLAGVLAAITTLFRYDTGLALICVLMAALAIAAWTEGGTTRERLTRFVANALPCLIAYAAVIGAIALLYVARAPLASFIYDIVIYPGKYYRHARNLPFPNVLRHPSDSIRIYLPLIILPISCAALFFAYKRPATSADSQPRSAALGFQVTFTLLAAAMYVKGLVRVGASQMYLANVATLLLITVLLANRNHFGTLLKRAIYLGVAVSAIGAVFPALAYTRGFVIPRFLFPEYFWQKQHGTLSAEQTAWCAQKNSFTRGLCFIPSPDRVKMVDFLDSHPTPDQKLFVGTGRHDRIFASDNILYFATGRLPATKWSQFDPMIQNTLPIQTQMVQELQTSAPPYVVLDTEFDEHYEPNDSTKSTGVLLLDHYLQANYRRIDATGTLILLERNSTPRP